MNKPRIKATHFIEQYNTASGRTKFNSISTIDNLDIALLESSNFSFLKTVAIFKLKSKDNAENTIHAKV